VALVAAGTAVLAGCSKSDARVGADHPSDLLDASSIDAIPADGSDAQSCEAGAFMFGCPCATPGALACNGPDMKLPVICSGGQWVAGTPCSATTNCDQRDGTCHDIVGACAGRAPGTTFCGPDDTPTTCGPDLTTTTVAAPCAGKCVDGSCQAPVCGDGKVEAGEACDDGNTTPLDGCEPAAAPIPSARCTPSRVLSLSLGDQHTCALYNGGYVRCWGDNTLGELGLGHTDFEGNNLPYQLTDRSGGTAGPIAFVGGGGVTALAAGNGFTCAVLSDGTVQCWGDNNLGQLGQGSATPVHIALPVVVPLGQPATGITVSRNQGLACAILVDGSVRCWGENAGGALGLGNATTEPSLTMTPAEFGPVSLGTSASALASGNGACALLTDGTIRCWGDNHFGELGQANNTALSLAMVPSAYGVVPLPSGRKAVSISMGSAFACARLDDGTAQCWGHNNAGQLGLGNTNTIGDDEPATAGAVVLGTTVSSLVSGVLESCALFASDGGWRCWGSNSAGELGYPDVDSRGGTSATTPSQLPPLSFGTGRTATAMFLGYANACALLDDGEVRCWGANASGQLGFGTLSPAVGGSASTTPDNATDTVEVLPP
jgi:cysteine-rich repeat protein